MTRMATPAVAPNDGPKRSRLIDVPGCSADRINGQATEALPVTPGSQLSMSTQTRAAGPTPEQVAEVLIAERDTVLGEMPHKHGWAGASQAAMQEAIDHAISQLWSRAYNDLDHVRAALRAAVKWRAKEHWNPRNHAVEERSGLEGDSVERFAIADDDHDAIVSALDAKALMPFARDCLAGLTETQAQIVRLRADDLGERTIAQQLGLKRKDVQRELYRAQKAIAQFAMVLEAGRVCGQRASSIAAYADGAANADEVRRAEAHLAACSACRAVFTQTKSSLGAQVASLVPVPALVMVAGPGRFGAILARFGDLVGGSTGGRGEALRETALGVFVRNPSAAETMAGAGLGGAGIAVGAKAAIGLCVAALAGGSAVCSSLGMLPEGLNIRHPDAPKVAKVRSEVMPKRTARAPAAISSFTSPTPAPTLSATTSTGSTVSSTSEAARAARAGRRKPALTRAALKRARAARSAAASSLQTSTPAGVTSGRSTSASAPSPTPPVPTPAAPQSSSPPKSTGIASPALTGTNGFENGAP